MTFKIFQNYFKDEQIIRLDSDFISNDNSSSIHSNYYEFLPMLNIYKHKVYKDADYTGVFSYKFLTKTGIDGKTFKKFVKDNPGYDVYFINPHPHLSYFYNNVWDQGECWHPGLKEIASKILKKLNICSNLKDIPSHDISLASYANFWIGNQTFWELYGKILLEIEFLLEEEYYKNMLFNTTYHTNLEAPFFPFFIERLFSTFISLHKELKCLSYSYRFKEIKEKCFFEEEEKLLDKVLKYNNAKISIDEISKEHCKIVKKLFKTNPTPKQLI